MPSPPRLPPEILQSMQNRLVGVTKLTDIAEGGVAAGHPVDPAIPFLRPAHLEWTGVTFGDIPEWRVGEVADCCEIGRHYGTIIRKKEDAISG